MNFDLEYYLTLYGTLVLGVVVIWNLFVKIKRPNLMTPITAVYLVFFWLPLLFDVIIGIPEYQPKFYNLELVSRHNEVCTIYNIYVFFTLFVFLCASRMKVLFIDKGEVQQAILFLKKYKVFFLLICFTPILFLLLTENFSNFLTYRALVSDFEIPDDPMYMLMVSSTMIVSIVAPLLIVSEELSVRKNYLVLLLLLVLLFFAVFLNGKRYIIAIIVIVYGGLHYYTGFKSRVKLLFNASICLCLFILFLSFYGKNSQSTFAESYSSLRIDLGRDDVTKYSIYKAFFDQDSPILNYPGQSVLFSLLFFIPRTLWSSKPYPYAVYLTASLLGYDSDIGYLGWSMTTSLFEELISNFSFIGFLTPIFYLLLLKWLNRKKIAVKFLGLFIIIMSIVVQLSAMMVPMILFGTLVLFNRNDKLKLRI